MVQHSSVATTCTASHLINWDIPGLSSPDQKLQVNTRINTVKSLMKSDYKLDFALLFIIVTEHQMRNFGLNEFLPKCGFELVFKGEKVRSQNRHKETGDLYLWATSPGTYKESLEGYLKELEELKDKIDPPKKPDPERLKMPDLLLSNLRKAKIVVDNASVDNPLSQILIATPKKAAIYIKIQFGFDVEQWDKNWTNRTTRSLKEAQKAWKNELV